MIRQVVLLPAGDGGQVIDGVSMCGHDTIAANAAAAPDTRLPACGRASPQVQSGDRTEARTRADPCGNRRANTTP